MPSRAAPSPWPPPSGTRVVKPRTPPAPLSPQTPRKPESIRAFAFQVTAPTTERIDRFLADQLALSRTQAARLIADGAITVNGAPARRSATLRRHDVVHVAIPDAAPPRHLAPFDRPLEVVHEDAALLVLDKPAGLVVHPAPGHWDDTLLNALVARSTRLSSGSGRPGIVHRLDKDTSGLLVVAKTDTAHRRLAHQLGRRRMRRVYAALVWGHLDGPLDIAAPVGRHPKDRKRMTVLPGGRPARTRAQQVARFATCDLVRVTLETGRTHQIRVHLAHAGHPVVGDPVYGGGGARRVTGAQRPQAEAVERVTPRQALHAAELAFRHPETHEEVVFWSDWPADLREALAAAAGDPALLARSSVLEYLGFRK